MALLKEDSSFTHVIAIDFGTGASGYIYFTSYIPNLLSTATELPQNSANKTANTE